MFWGLSNRRNRIAFAHDLVMAAISFPLALYLRLGDTVRWVGWEDLAQACGLFALVAALVFPLGKLYRGIWRYASIPDLVAILRAATLAILIFLPILFFLTRLEWVPRSAPLIQWFVLLMLLGGPRFLYRIWRDRRLPTGDAKADGRVVPILLVGVGDEAELFLRNQSRRRGNPYRVCGMLDEKGSRIGFELHGVPVLGHVDELAAILDRLPAPKPQRLVLTRERMDGGIVRRLLDEAERLGLTVARLPQMSVLQSAAAEGGQAPMRPIAIEDLLGRPQTRLDPTGPQNLLRGARVMVTGAGGSIGSELVRQVAGFCPAEIVLFESSEFNLYQIDMELREAHPEITRRPVLGDVRDALRLDDVLARFNPSIVFHAAALKHVPMVETNPLEGILVNAIGSRTVADACRRAGVELMVMISTDKAVNPTNVMGATKRLAEMWCQALDASGPDVRGRTRFAAVRFGNVLGSTGSVVPLFQRQLAKGGPLTVTHPEVTRYFMTIREAVELVLQAAGLSRVAEADCHGRIFVLDMGEPVRIIDLARQMIRLAGFEPERDIRIEFTGLRPGEKLYEELLHDSETEEETSVSGLFVAAPRHADLPTLTDAFDRLEEYCRNRRRAEALRLLSSLVPEYRPEAAGLPATPRATGS